MVHSQPFFCNFRTLILRRKRNLCSFPVEAVAISISRFCLEAADYNGWFTVGELKKFQSVGTYESNNLLVEICLDLFTSIEVHE